MFADVIRRGRRGAVAAGVSCLMMLATVSPVGAAPILADRPPADDPGFQVAVPGTVTLVEETDLGALATPIIDPSGIVYLEGRNRLIVSDSEIDEEPSVFDGSNLFELTRGGVVTREGVSPEAAGDPKEPTGLTFDPSRSELIISNDSTDTVYAIKAGPDGVFGTGDDPLRSFGVSSLGITDIEDVAYAPNPVRLYLLDGNEQRVHELRPGANGVFDGIPPAGDDSSTSFSVAALGIFNPLGLEHRARSDTLLVTSNHSDAIYEVTKSGHLLREFDLDFLKLEDIALRPSDLAVAPASDGSGASRLYVTDRGEDNGTPGDGVPPPKDGRLLELAASFPNLAPVVDAGPSATVSLGESLTLVGTAYDDGVPAPNALSVTWSKVSGPAGVGFGDKNATSTVVSFGGVGSYTIELEATDGVWTTSDTVDVTVEPSSSGFFVDDDNSIFEADIEWIASRGITIGCNPPDNYLFCPKDPVTRGQMAAFLVRGLALTAGAGADVFVDDDGSVFEMDIDRLATDGITSGCNPPANDRYCPDRLVTRGEMAAFLVRAKGYVEVSGSNRFVDDDESIFELDIDRLATAGVTLGCNPPANDLFCPEDPVTREQMAAFLHRALE